MKKGIISLFLPIFIFTTSFFTSSSWSWGWVKLSSMEVSINNYARTPLSIFFSLVVVLSPFFFCKGNFVCFGVWGKELLGHLMTIFSLSLPFFFTPFSFLLSFTHLLFQCKRHYSRWSGASFWRFGQWHVWSIRFTHYSSGTRFCMCFD